MYGQRRLLVSYAVAVTATAAAVFVRWLLNPLLDHRLPFITLYGAVAVAVWFGGWRPALVATILGYVAADLVFVETEPGTPLSWHGSGGIAGLVVYLLSCLILIGLGSGMRAAQRRSEAAALEALAKQKQFETAMMEHRQTEGALRAKEAELDLITTRTPLLLTRCSKDLRYVFVNRASAEFLGRRPEEIVGRPIVEIMGERAFAEIQPHIERVLHGEQVEFETVIPYAHPGRRFMHVTYTPDRDARGEVVGWVASVADVTERKRAEEAIRASEDRFGRFMQYLPGLAWIKDLEGRYVYANDAAETAFRTPRTKLYGKTDDEVFPPETAAQFKANDQRAVASGTSVQAIESLEHEDGILHYSLVSKFPVPGPDGQAALVGGMAIDITDQMRAKESLRENETRLAAEADALARLNELSSRLWRMRSLREGLEEMLAATIELLGADRGNVQILDADRGVLAIAAQRGFQQDYLDFFREMSTKDDSACGRGLRSGARIVIEDVEADAPYAPLRAIARAADYRAVQSTPLIGRDGTPLGMLSTHWRSVHRPSEQDLRRLDLYVRQAADFIERCRTDEVLRDADRRKDEFLAMLAHELRGPLAPLRNMLEIMKRAEGNGDLLEKARNTMEQQLGQLVRLVDDLIDVNRITRNKIELHKERVELASLIQQSLEACRPLAESAGHEVNVTLPEQPIYLDGDPVRLTQVFSNILNNANKYTEPRGRIWLSAERQGSDVVVRVKDAGVGIPPDQLGSVFEMFTQIDRTLERSQGGLGIGLTLVKRLVEMHDGTVTAHSEGPGKGSEFVVRLPILVEQVEQDAPRHPAETTATPRRILVVDDNTDTASSLAMLLSMNGHETYTAFDGLEAVQAAEQFRPEAILLDIGLPKLNGYDVCRRIREQSWGNNMVIVALTGWGQEDDRRKSAEAGFDGHLVKPVKYATLMDLLATCSEQRGQLIER